MNSERNLAQGVIPVCKTRIVLFLLLGVPMMWGFGWETMATFRLAQPLQELTCAELQTEAPTSVNVRISDFSPDSADHLGFHGSYRWDPVPIRQPERYSYVYVPLVPTGRRTVGEKPVLAKIYGASNAEEIREFLSVETLPGELRYPYQFSVTADDEIVVINELLPNVRPWDCMILETDLTSFESKNPWTVFFRSLLMLGFGTGILIFLPLKEVLFRGVERQLACIVMGACAIVMGSYVLIENPRGPAFWNPHSSTVAMYLAALGCGMFVVSLGHWVNDQLRSTQRASLEATAELDAHHELGGLRFEYKEVDDFVALVVGALTLVVYSLCVWNYPLHIAFKMAGGTIIALGVISVCYLIPSARKYLRYFERGIVISSVRKGRLTLPFDEIRSCTPKIVHNLSHGIYTGTAVELEITPTKQRPTIKYRLSVRRDTVGYERAMELINDIAQAQAAARDSIFVGANYSSENEPTTV